MPGSCRSCQAVGIFIPLLGSVLKRLDRNYSFLLMAMPLLLELCDCTGVAAVVLDFGMASVYLLTKSRGTTVLSYFNGGSLIDGFAMGILGALFSTKVRDSRLDTKLWRSGSISGLLAFFLLVVL